MRIVYGGVTVEIEAAAETPGEDDLATALALRFDDAACAVDFDSGHTRGVTVNRAQSLQGKGRRLTVERGGGDPQHHDSQ